MLNDGKNRKLHFWSQDYDVIPNYGRGMHCFAGQDDELVVAASGDYGLFVWSLPNNDNGSQIEDQLLVVLRGHRDAIYRVRYNRRSETLASVARFEAIKLWEPIVQN